MSIIYQRSPHKIAVNPSTHTVSYTNMPRAERGTPKDIANRSKAKGLQKLRWYCQMCNKQCRDENGMKCHMTSESHLRQMKIFSQNAGSLLDQFSGEFEKVYLETLRRRHGTKRMNANNVYQEVIQDKHHVHMNSTMWGSLTDFVQYLGKKGKCIVDETERGWYVQYIERDPYLLEREEAAQRRAEAERIEEIKTARRMEKQRAEAAAALDKAGGVVSVAPSKIDRSNVGTISISIGSLKKAKTNTATTAQEGHSKNVPLNDNQSERLHTKEEFDGMKSGKKRERNVNVGIIEENNDIIKKAKKPLSALEQIFLEDKERERIKLEKQKHLKEKESKDSLGLKDRRKENWIQEGIIVRIISKKLGKKSYYKQKGVVEAVKNKFTAIIALEGKDIGDVLHVYQRDLETVIPKKTGKEVLILNGRGRGFEAIVESLDKDNYKAVLTLLDKSKQRITDVDFEDFSELA